MAQVNLTAKQAKLNWDSYYKNLLSSVNADLTETEVEKKKRIKKLEADFEEWKKYYFPKYCSSPAAPFHKRASRRILDNAEWYESRVWARELAKDALCMFETLYQALIGIKSNILFISNSWDKAAELLEPYRIELSRNERIINDYGIQMMPGSWTYGDFVTTQGVSFLAVGADQSPRGSRQENIRPDKVIYSDIDTDQDVLNPDIIDKRWKWCEKAVFPTRAVDKPFQVIWLGNLIAKDCCVARATKKADHVDVVNLEDKQGNSSWPEKNTREHIDRIKSKISTAAYMAEYMNTPLAEGSTFKQMVWGKVPALTRFRFLITYGDPSPSNSKNKKGSQKSTFLIGFYQGKYYVITGFLDHATNSEFCDWFFSLREFIGGKTQGYNYIENNSLQNPFYEQVLLPLFSQKIEEKGWIGITPDERNKPEKFSRIEGNLEPLNRNGHLILNEAERNNPHMLRLEEQFLLLSPKLTFPADGPDCIEGGITIINQKLTELTDAIKIGSKHTNQKRY